MDPRRGSIIVGPSLGVSQDIVGLLYFLESSFIATFVRMMLAGKAPMRGATNMMKVEVIDGRG